MRKNFKPSRFKSGRQYGNNRKKSRSKSYDQKWREYRKRFLEANPRCYCCPKRSEVVDHIKAHKGSERLFKAVTNHIPLCTGCHNEITGRFDMHNVPLLDEKLEWINNQRKELGITVKVKVLSYYER